MTERPVVAGGGADELERGRYRVDSVRDPHVLIRVVRVLVIGQWAGQEAIPSVGDERTGEHRVADRVEHILKAAQERTIDLLDRLPDGERAEYEGDDRGRDEGATEEAQHGSEYLLLAEECGDDDQDQANDECERVGQEHRSSNPDGGGGSHAAGSGVDLGDDLHHAQGRVADGDAGEGGVGFVGAEIGERDPRVR
jgi:hypothetical protein